ncbi:c-type cytochrome [Psychrobacter sp. S1-30-MNA-CIBAN-0213]|uniref:c-type cytochrome n=1 Tax=unclassified Psychrobacter TaxID=196806 RepID=UPI003318EAF4
MINKKQRMNKRPLSKLTWSVISISTLLTLSACSGDNTPTEEPAAVNEPADTTVVVDEAPIVEPEVITPEPVVEPTDTVVEEVAQEVAAEPEVLAADAGAKLYETNCKVCHESGLLDAPKYGDKAAWAPRLTKGTETLHMHSAKGFNKMPAQATDKVSEAQVYAAVDYMIAAVS